MVLILLVVKGNLIELDFFFQLRKRGFHQCHFFVVFGVIGLEIKLERGYRVLELLDLLA